MGLWRDHLLPRLVDKGLAGEEHARLRAAATAGLAGRVLEIGFGSGLNLQYLPPEVTRVEAVEPTPAGRKLAAPRIAAARAEVAFAGSDAQAIALPDGCIDAALSTWSLCSVGDARRALGEVRRLLVPGGRFHFVEHGLAPDAGVQRWQRRLEPLQRLLFGGCRLMLPVDALLAEAGFTLERLDTEYIAGPRFSSYVYRGVARAEVHGPSDPGGRT
jgi:SAM-dependent methyltransferase